MSFTIHQHTEPGRRNPGLERRRSSSTKYRLTTFLLCKWSFAILLSFAHVYEWILHEEIKETFCTPRSDHNFYENIFFAILCWHILWLLCKTIETIETIETCISNKKRREGKKVNIKLTCNNMELLGLRLRLWLDVDRCSTINKVTLFYETQTRALNKLRNIFDHNLQCFTLETYIFKCPFVVFRFVLWDFLDAAARTLLVVVIYFMLLTNLDNNKTGFHRILLKLSARAFHGVCFTQSEWAVRRQSKFLHIFSPLISYEMLTFLCFRAVALFFFLLQHVCFALALTTVQGTRHQTSVANAKICRLRIIILLANQQDGKMFFPSTRIHFLFLSSAYWK